MNLVSLIYLCMYMTNKNDIIYKSVAQEIRQINVNKYRVAAHKLLQNIISEQKSYL